MTRQDEEERRIIFRMVKAIESIAADLREIRLLVEGEVYQDDEECDEDG